MTALLYLTPGIAFGLWLMTGDPQDYPRGHRRKTAAMFALIWLPCVVVLAWIGFAVRMREMIDVVKEGHAI